MINEMQRLIGFLGVRRQHLEHALERGVVPGYLDHLELNYLKAKYDELNTIYEEVTRLYDLSKQSDLQKSVVHK